jgi:hypothetical protein
VPTQLPIIQGSAAAHLVAAFRSLSAQSSSAEDVGSLMRYFRITYEWHSRPRYREGRLGTCQVTFAASNQTDAYKLAQDDGKIRFPRHRWRVLYCEELTGIMSDS